MDEHDRARARAESGVERGVIDVPAAVVGQLVGPQPHQLERHQVVEQRVGRRRDQDLVFGIAQQLEEERVGLARRCG